MALTDQEKGQIAYAIAEAVRIALAEARSWPEIQAIHPLDEVTQSAYETAAGVLGLKLGSESEEA